MALQIAEAFVAAFETYVFAGLAFAVVFLPRAVEHVDPRIVSAPKTLRLLILPGIAALWPLFAWRWITGAHEPREKNPHRAKVGGFRAVTSEPACRVEPT